MNQQVIRERFLQDSLSRKLGAIAANLGRVSSFSKGDRNEKLLKNLLEESEFFIEWTTAEAALPLQEKLVQLQIQLAIWILQFQKGKVNFDVLVQKAQIWSDQLLEEAGFFDNHE